MNIFDEKLKNANSICILGHERPDGDCIGSALGIYNYILNKFGASKKVKVLLDDFSKKFFILPGSDKILNDDKIADIFDLVIIVDSSNLDRLGKFKRYLDESKDSILFDHHENNLIPSKVSIVFPDSIATCEIIYNFLDKSFVDKNVAMCLYVGIATDSGVFRYRNTSKNTFKIAGELIDYGFNFTELLDHIIFNNSVLQRKSQGLAFDKLKLICKGQVSFSYITSDELMSLNLTKNDIDNIIVYLREIENIKVAAFAYQVGNDKYKLSLRSKLDSVNLVDFAIKHDGGGHALAAGCMYYGTIDIIEKKFEKDMADYLEGK